MALLALLESPFIDSQIAGNWPKKYYWPQLGRCLSSLNVVWPHLLVKE
jgi:hypothetical protein